MNSEEQEKKDQIWKFVLEHQELFCDPPPEGLGFPRPGMIPGLYLKRAGGVAPGPDPCPETETGASAPGRHRRPDRVNRNGPGDTAAA